MLRIGFPRPRMREERRIALLPHDISSFIKHSGFLFFEKGYGRDYGISDEAYRSTGAHVVDSRRAYSLDVLCQPKFCLEDSLHLGLPVRTIFGWLHLDKESDKSILDLISQRQITAIAWELMRRDGRNVFWVNGVLTGQIGILHAIPYAGKTPEDCSVAIIGRRRVGNAALKQLELLGVKKIDVYHTGNSQELKLKVDNYDVIVDCACSDTEVLSTQDLAKMKPGALLIDMARSCMWGGYAPQSIYSPIVYINEGRNPVYCIRNIPTLAYQTATKHNSKDIAPYVNMIVKEEMDKTLRDAVVVEKGVIVNGKV